MFKVRCSECDTLAYSRPLLLKHMTNTHGFEAPLINKTFESREELQVSINPIIILINILVVAGRASNDSCCGVRCVFWFEEVGIWSAGNFYNSF